METLEGHHFLEMETFADPSLFHIVIAVIQYLAFRTLGLTSCLQFLFFFLMTRNEYLSGAKGAWNIFTFFLEISVSLTLEKILIVVMALLEYVYMFKEYELGFGFQILRESISEIFGKIYFNISIYNMHFLSKLQTRERCRELWEDHAGKGGMLVQSVVSMLF